MINPEPEPDIRVVLLLGTAQTPMTSSSGSFWFCEVTEGLDFSSTAFASVRLERGDHRLLTQLRWIDHLVELRNSSQATKFLGPIQGLESSASRAEQMRMLDDLQNLAHALFTDSASFTDIAFGSPQQSPNKAEPPAPPVDPASLIRKLEEAAEPHAMSGGAPISALSLTGILRLLFDAERAVTDVAADDENLDEGQSPNPHPRAPKKKAASDQKPENSKPVDSKLQARLAGQIETFLKNLSEPDCFRGDVRLLN